MSALLCENFTVIAWKITETEACKDCSISISVVCCLTLFIPPEHSYFFNFKSLYSKTSLNRTLLFQKVVRFSKISVYTKCRIAPANRTKFGLWGGFSGVSAGKLQANPNIVQIAHCLTEICSVYVKTRK